MFQKLKHKTRRTSVFKNRELGPHSYSKIPGATSSVTEGNEADRLVRCMHCGFICDKERDVRLPDGSYAGFGIALGSQLTAGTSIGDRRVPAAGTVNTTVDQYYSRTIQGGCPCCGSYLFDPKQKHTYIP